MYRLAVAREAWAGLKHASESAVNSSALHCLPVCQSSLLRMKNVWTSRVLLQLQTVAVMHSRPMQTKQSPDCLHNCLA